MAFILATTLLYTVILAIVMGVVHYILKRHRKKLEATKRQRDLEVCRMLRATLLNIRVDANVSSDLPPNSAFMSPSRTVSPLNHVLLSPERAQYYQNVNDTGHASSMYSLTPISALQQFYSMENVGLRSLMSPVNGVQNPLQVYDPATRRTIYSG